MKSTIPNVLADRYASSALRNIWSAEGRILLEREFWIAVMKAQRELGLDIPAEAIDAYEKVKERIDLDAINARERVTRHDVKARIEEFNDLAGYEHIHKGMTSRDLTENVEQLQVWKSLQVIRDKGVAMAAKLAGIAVQYRDLTLAGRTHNVAAQPTTFGKRVAMFGEELLMNLQGLISLMERYAVRGLKGAVGTQLDQLSLFAQNAETVATLEKKICTYLGIPRKWTNVGQVYPRSLDYAVVSSLVEVTASCSSFCKTLRLMSGHELASEGFAPGQTGSSAMPHKMNARSCERVNGFHVILKGHLTMAAGLAGDQWNEGDVSCSVVRRVVMPDSFFAADGLMETFLTILNQMEAYPAVISTELNRYLPFLLTTTILMESVKKGVGRETAHEVIKEHAVATVKDLRSGTVVRNDLMERLAKDGRLLLTISELEEIFKEGENAVGMAGDQVDSFCCATAKLVERFPEAAGYQPGDIL